MSALLARLVVASGAAVFAPESPFPAAVDDASRADEALLARGVDPGRLVVGGDSAGAALACAVAQRVREAAARCPPPCC